MQFFQIYFARTANSSILSPSRCPLGMHDVARVHYTRAKDTNLYYIHAGQEGKKGNATFGTRSAPLRTAAAAAAAIRQRRVRAYLHLVAVSGAVATLQPERGPWENDNCRRSGALCYYFALTKDEDSHTHTRTHTHTHKHRHADEHKHRHTNTLTHGRGTAAVGHIYMYTCGRS